MADELFNELKNLPTMKDVFEFIQNRFPQWIVDIVDKYSIDYPELVNNWKTISTSSKTPMQKIIIVQNFENDEHLTLAELLTQCGFVVRTINEYIPCSVCKSAIPSQTVYNKMKEMNKDVPLMWNNKCHNC